MEEKKEKKVKGEFYYDQDSKRYHRYMVVADEDVVGVIYVPKQAEQIPDTVILKKRSS